MVRQKGLSAGESISKSVSGKIETKGVTEVLDHIIPLQDSDATQRRELRPFVIGEKGGPMFSLPHASLQKDLGEMKEGGGGGVGLTSREGGKRQSGCTVTSVSQGNLEWRVRKESRRETWPISDLRQQERGQETPSASKKDGKGWKEGVSSQIHRQRNESKS